MTIPDVTWNKRHRPEGAAEFTWHEESSEDIFKGKRYITTFKKLPIQRPNSITNVISNTAKTSFSGIKI